MSKKYIVDIASVYEVDEKTADEIKERQDSQNQAWIIDQVKKGMVYVCDVIEQDGFEHTGEPTTVICGVDCDCEELTNNKEQ